MIAGVAYASTPSSPAYSNVNYFGRQDVGTPPMQCILVRNGFQDKAGATPAIASGDCLVWDTTSADAFTITMDNVGYGFAGIAVTSIATPDTSQVSFNEDNWGYMCIKGRVLAKIDVSQNTVGYPLHPNGNNLAGAVGTTDARLTGVIVISNDVVGVSLFEPASDGLGVVWLR